MGLSASLRHVALRCMWNFLHGLITFYSITASLLARFNFAKLFDHLPGYHRDFGRAQSDAKILARIPSHLGLVWSGDPSRHGLENLLELITWSAGFNVPVVSVYDRHGFWRSKKEEIRLMMEKRTSSCATSSAKSCLQIVSSNEKLLSAEVDHVEPYDFTVYSGTSVIFLSEIDGKHCIAEAARDVCLEVRAGTLSDVTINEGVLDHFIRRKRNFLDPDLVIKIGKLDSLSGYLPWHVRLTSIIFSPAREERCLSYQSFKDALAQFSRVEQRVGR
ncbi:putative Dehydrodolichyl diphosphate syntase complex subunit nus1 [Hypsibius exemplaris]|uniref:ditrans,polycis-polyprenyl diphosphate synthase [(2E,6E)-farnesyldiphosphate specific] n=1 Tax=Hypsibius exemplaris TaxID=2072580 RepID=A0A1W0WJN7_HYPEX|nr:putative Dehydrodolichyl diphosphate syntase complex subunit nus1 [Hypsibius exemplaris]